MATFITLSKFTEQGIRSIKESPNRAEAFKEMAKKHGCTLKDIYWTQGQYDMIAIIESRDEMTANALLLSAAALGNLTTETLRAYSSAEMKTIIGKMG